MPHACGHETIKKSFKLQTGGIYNLYGCNQLKIY
jgi:hypothetical protein